MTWDFGNRVPDTMNVRKTVSVGVENPAFCERTQDNGSSFVETTGGDNVVMNSQDTAANGDYLYVGSNTQFDGLQIAIDNSNSNAAVLSADYWNGSAWTALTLTDNTASGGATLAIAGSVRFTAMPANWETTTVNARSQYWVRLKMSAALDASVQIDVDVIARRQAFAANNGAKKRIMRVVSGTQCFWGPEGFEAGSQAVATDAGAPLQNGQEELLDLSDSDINSELWVCVAHDNNTTNVVVWCLEDT